MEPDYKNIYTVNGYGKDSNYTNYKESRQKCQNKSEWHNAKEANLFIWEVKFRKENHWRNQWKSMIYH